MSVRAGGDPTDPRIEALREAVVGRRVIEVRTHVATHEDGRTWEPGYPELVLNDGSVIALLDGWGAPPLVFVEREPYREPLRWEGDDG